MNAVQASSLMARLPHVRGELTENAPLAEFTWFRVGGPAEVLFRPADRDDLAAFLKGCPADVPVTVIGVGSNLLVRDGGVKGVVIRLGRAFAGARKIGETRLEVGTAMLDAMVSRAAMEAGIEGLEFYRGIPGSIGGALRMNAGAHGGETKDVFVEAEAVTRQGEIIRLTPADMGFSYRHTDVAGDLIFTSAILEGRKGDKDAIAQRMAEVQEHRENAQPIKSRTGGSTFKNPEGGKAWQLVDAAGCRGLKVGGAQVSEMHCNFLINTGNATARDIETLGEEVRARVKKTSGIELHWEIKRIGEAA